MIITDVLLSILNIDGTIRTLQRAYRKLMKVEYSKNKEEI